MWRVVTPRVDGRRVDVAEAESGEIVLGCCASRLGGGVGGSSKFECARCRLVVGGSTETLAEAARCIRTCARSDMVRSEQA